MEQEYIITVFSENKVGLLSQITTVFTCRDVNIESLTTSASALRISTVWPEKRVIRSPGSMLVGEMRFSQVGITAVTLTRTPCRARACRAAAAAAPPAMSPLMPAIEEADFRQ